MLEHNHRPLVSVVLLSHDRPDYLRRAIASILAQSYPHLELIVVDNRSDRSDEIARIVGGYPGVRLIRNDENLWYTGGMNRGIEAATGFYVHCTVDDVLLERDCIERLVAYAETNEGCGLLTGTLYAADRRTIMCAGGEFSLTPIYRRKIHGEGQQDSGQFPEPFHVTCVDGAMVFSPLGLIKKLKGFREDFFIYVDSIELSARVLKLGYKIVVVPAAKAYVLYAPHAFTSEGVAFHKVKNLFAFYVLHARARVLPEFFVRYGVVQPLQKLFSEPRIFRQMLRAWGWLILRAPALLRERWMERRYEVRAGSPPA